MIKLEKDARMGLLSETQDSSDKLRTLGLPDSLGNFP